MHFIKKKKQKETVDLFAVSEVWNEKRAFVPIPLLLLAMSPSTLYYGRYYTTNSWIWNQILGAYFTTVSPFFCCLDSMILRYTNSKILVACTSVLEVVTLTCLLFALLINFNLAMWNCSKNLIKCFTRVANIAPYQEVSDQVARISFGCTLFQEEIHSAFRWCPIKWWCYLFWHIKFVPLEFRSKTYHLSHFI